jgi:hypothetical protein
MLALYSLARLPEPSAEARAAQARNFRFEGHPITIPNAGSMRSVRAVHPSLARISAWISAVGAAVALADLNDDGLSDDVCLVDPRTDHVILSRVGAVPVTPRTLDLQPWMKASSMAPMGCLPGDVNEDGRVDLLVYFWGRPPVIFLQRAGGGAEPTYVGRPLIPGDEAWYTNAVTRADLDGDGHADLLVANYFPDGAAILDASGTGIEEMQASMSRARNGGEKHVFLWTPPSDGSAEPTFRRVTNALPPDVSRTWTLALAAGDLDGDLLPEIYSANDFGPDVLLHNESTPGRLHFTALHGRQSLTMPRSKVLGSDSFKGMGVDFASLNPDGIPDIVVSNIAAEFALEESHFAFLSTGDVSAMKRGVAPYVDASEALGLSRSGWAWDVKLEDFNNDGVLEVVQATGFVRGGAGSSWPQLHELAMGNDQLLHDPRSWPRFEPGIDLDGHDHNPFFVRHPDGRYYDVAPDVGLGDESVSRGIATGDVDGDGRLDFVIANQWAPSAFFLNRAPAAGAFLGLRLVRPVDPREPFAIVAGRPGHLSPGVAAVGATARVHLRDGGILAREVDGGNGHSGKRSPELHFGLGAVPADATVDVELRWRTDTGRQQARRLRLTAGWHTVLLGH